MITKNTVMSIIAQNDAICSEKSVDFQPEITVEDLKWSEQKLNLKDQIASLPENELIDLLALMEYGREHYHKKDNVANHNEFISMRTNQASSFDPHEKSNKATYLLQKGRFLTLYLNYALGLYN